jgi:hypothetical protein
MKKRLIVICLAIFLGINLSIVSANINLNSDENEINNQIQNYEFSNDYGIQWEMNWGDDSWYGARYEGPQPIGDCDDDGKNEMLVAGRDNKIRVYKWNEEKQTYLEKHTLFPPYYPNSKPDAGGFAIGDVTGDGKNEIGATWGAALHKWKNGKYRTIAVNSWIFDNGGGSGDCYIGDYDNDGENELIVCGGPWDHKADVPELVMFKWNGYSLVKEAEWNSPNPGYTYIYMAGLGDIDDDGENEIVLGSAFKVYVLDWDKDTKSFEEQVIKTTGEGFYPFACVLKDSDNDGKNEVNLAYYGPMISVFKWNGVDYELIFEKHWQGEGALIEGLDVGDVDYDGKVELCAGTHLVHILEWNGDTYVEEAVLPTYGELAVVSVGDCDNDGKDEIQAGSVMIDWGEDYVTWVYKYGIEPVGAKLILANGRLRVFTKSALFNQPVKEASVAAWNLDTKTWYDIQPVNEDLSSYYRNDLPEGEYHLRAFMEGYQVGETTITINAGEETTHTFKLSLSLSKTIAQRYNSFPIFSRIRDRVINLLDK